MDILKIQSPPVAVAPPVINLKIDNKEYYEKYFIK